VALHEIGHIRGRLQLSRSRVVRERWAWRWAEENALVWTPAMDRNRQRSMAFYARGLEHAPNRGGIEFLDAGQGVRLKPPRKKGK
jgi:hypothetical protein